MAAAAAAAFRRSRSLVSADEIVSAAGVAVDIGRRRRVSGGADRGDGTSKHAGDGSSINGLRGGGGGGGGNASCGEEAKRAMRCLRRGVLLP